ncbi:MAG TPA: molybdopterin cofactor-binding domain-containing protein, partial [Longimicrobiales bacterium]
MSEERTGRSFSRRAFLRTGAEAGVVLVVAIHLPLNDAAAAEARGDAEVGFHPAAWIEIGRDGVVSVVVDEHELGQGVLTALPMIVAEELGADWARMKPLPPPEDPSTWVRSISTGGSTSIRTAWEPLRKAAATAREMLKTAASQKWSVPVAECGTEQGFVVHRASGRKIAFGELVEAASKLPVPANPPLKPSADYTLLGKPKPRVEIHEKVGGSAVYGMDVDLPGMLTATVALPPAFGATLRSVDDAGARAVPGVVDVLRLQGGVAVVAKNTWAAIKGRQALKLDWDTSPARGLGSEALFREFAELARQPGQVTRNTGDAASAIAGAARVVEGEYLSPFIDHIPMEPMNAAALLKDGKLEVWVPTQIGTASQQVAAQVAGLQKSDVKMHFLLAGGGFGRRLNPDDTWLAVEVAKRMPGTPVHVVWTREDSVRHGFYRPLTYHRLRAGLDAAGNPIAWMHHICGAAEAGLVGRGDEVTYGIPNVHSELHTKNTAVPVGAWRSVHFTHLGWVVESFMDELATAGGKDPYQLRRGLLAPNPKLLACLELVAQKAGWGKALPAGHALGIAAVSSFASHAAEVAEVSVTPDGQVKVHRVVAAVHVGTVINPDMLRSQVEGAITLALSYTLKHQIIVQDGAVKEGNFDDYPIMRIDDMPPVDVHVVPSDEAPTGIGEPPVPPLPGAVCNAIAAATGK